MQALTAHLQKHISQANMQIVSNTMWACAELAWPALPGFVEDMADFLLRNLSQAEAQHVAAVLQACAKLAAHLEPHLLQALADHMLYLLQNGRAGSRETSTFLWSCAKLGMHPSSGFLHAVIQHEQNALRLNSDVRNIANTLWACATLQVHLSGTFLEAAADRLKQQLVDLNKIDMSQLAFAYAHYQHRPSNGLLEAVAPRFQQLQAPTSRALFFQMRTSYVSLGLQPDMAWCKAV